MREKSQREPHGVLYASIYSGLDRDVPPKELTIPSLTQQIKWYCEKSGRSYPLEKFDHCAAFSFVRGSVISQGIGARAAVGQNSSPDAWSYYAKIPEQMRLAREIIQQAETGTQTAAKL